jgi:hypothetical protein
MFFELLGLFSPTLPKLSGAFVRVTGKTPVPVKVVVWGLFEALSVTLRVPLSAPRALGVNVTLIAQLFPGPGVLGLRGQLPLQT